MSEFLLWVGATAFMLGMWGSCNVMYGKVHGRRLRLRYMWAAQGALLFLKRFPEWEERESDQVPSKS